ncbi:uncharacterized protein TRIVIDRAFT_70526 [Trichoderma virens Gv29-8]|uniref:Uncharacterized protein n=1 Tax=Hypocrea virens (strain Gv29-8 / FGSC 10586) TaxID=413071 RepID=G9MG95_HYPVG|nr:uncharacterized protein TRIVIDRAFT_70526 [Trichoderma virens Gv29-8]EHK26545.1 hypothetical protein TRIVIDRAFT_70526 [Trichoderma virens Gv29-8]UKZ46724.1 hypothetical protein TrVGV298_000931 [Trichoderma virens]
MRLPRHRRTLEMRPTIFSGNCISPPCPCETLCQAIFSIAFWMRKTALSGLGRKSELGSAKRQRSWDHCQPPVFRQILRLHPNIGAQGAPSAKDSDALNVCQALRRIGTGILLGALEIDVIHFATGQGCAKFGAT